MASVGVSGIGASGEKCNPASSIGRNSEPMALGPGNHLLYGDNATVMRDMMGSQSVDLIYLDPPFKSDRNYNLIYSTLTGLPVPEQEEAFCDTWQMNTSKAELTETLPKLMRDAGVDPVYLNFWMTWVQSLQGAQTHLLAYLYYMVERLLWMKPLLKSNGSIFLHCDPSASHYIKVMMDGIFGHQNFRNEIIWQRTSAKSLMTRQLPNNHDVILSYQMSDKATWNADAMFQPYDIEHLDEKTSSKYSHRDASGRLYRLDNLINPNPDRPNLTYEFLGVKRVWRWTRERMQEAYNQGLVIQTKPGSVPQFKRYLDEQRGRPIGDVWTDIPPVNSQAKERLGYPTQKPKALLKRIVSAATRPGDVVFDPFCGCGTTIYATQELGDRSWVGCDIAILAVRVVREVLTERYRLSEGVDFKVSGVPNSSDSAQDLFQRDPFQFQHWAVERVGGFPTVRKTGDRGVDGRIYYETADGLRSMILSVKGGKLKLADVRDLLGTMQDMDGTDLGGFISLGEPTDEMRRLAARAGEFVYRDVKYPKLQLLTVRDIVEDKREFKCPTKVGARISTGQGALPL